MEQVHQQLREIFSRICFTLERQVTIRKTIVDLKPGENRGDDVPIDDTVARVIFAARSTQADTLFTASAPGDASASAEQFEARGTFNAQNRQNLLNQAQAIAYEEAPWIWLWRPYDLYGVSNELDWTPRSDGLIYLYEPTTSQ